MSYDFTKDEIRNYLLSGNDIANKSLQEQKAIIQSFIESIIVSADDIKIRCVVSNSSSEGVQYIIDTSFTRSLIATKITSM
jgi:hypothetical protein